LNNDFDIAERTRRVISFQLMSTVAVAIAFLAGSGMAEGRAALYGGFIGVALTFLLGRGVKRAEQVAAEDPRRGMTILYIGAAQRFFLALAAFAAGLSLLQLAPLPLFIGFAAAQFSYLVNARGMAQVKKGVAR
jgi:ATP synthase protein I